MRLLRNALKNRRSQLAPAAPRRHSTAIALELPFYTDATEKTPQVIMFTRDSSSSLPQASPKLRPGHPRSPPQSPYWAKRPTLSEILSDESPEPWSLAAFTEYCQQNLCLENLNFIMETREYKAAYDEWAFQCEVPPTADDQERAARVMALWRRILAEYTIPGGPQEINLPGDVRAPLLSARESELPNSPDVLQPAVRKIRELMQDSIFPGFLNEVRAPSASVDRLEDLSAEPPADEPRQKSRSIQIAAQPPGSPTHTSGFAHAAPNSNLYQKHSHGSMASSWRHNSSTSSRPVSKPRSIGSAKDPAEWSGSHSTYAASIDDTGSDTSDPSTARGSKRSPVPQPPLSTSYDSSQRPGSRSRSDSGWKKFSSKLGLKKHRGTTPSRDPKENEHAVVDD